MANIVIVAVVLGAIAAYAAGSRWGMATGVAAGVLVILVGLVVAVLRRNARDLEELEKGNVPDEVNDALGEDEPPAGRPL